MIIGIDAGCLSIGDERLKTGVYQVGLNLLGRLSEIDKSNRYLAYSFLPISNEALSYFGPNMQNKILRPRRFWLTTRVSIELLFKKPDVFLGLGQSLPLICPSKSIVFVYDLAFEHYPNCYPGSFARLSRQTRYAVRHSKKLISISESTKEDLVKLYGANREEIEVAYPGVDSIFKPQPRREIEKIRKEYNLKRPYFLFVGSLKPVKNIPKLIVGFNRFLRAIKKPYQLILVGSDFWLDKEIPRIINRLKLTAEVVNLGFLPRRKLPGIYSGAIAFASPSLYEGFGIPLVEAMACGIPVITSNIGSMPEVVRRAGLFVSPNNADEISRALFKIVKSKKLVDALKEEGLRRARDFTWEKFAIKVLTTISSLK